MDRRRWIVWGKSRTQIPASLHIPAYPTGKKLIMFCLLLWTIVTVTQSHVRSGFFGSGWKCLQISHGEKVTRDRKCLPVSPPGWFLPGILHFNKKINLKKTSWVILQRKIVFIYFIYASVTVHLAWAHCRRKAVDRTVYCSSSSTKRWTEQRRAGGQCIVRGAGVWDRKSVV